eukprot:CAMPEP_0171491960 /NCGR_PEP_ID=MMETSP0958-20121227/4148_1 /TAXON_ID=87120 /ORGANISM="Aurantiochytrium limacinum, Strain ATCCMYA-1381" /LENGTH=446 /DNA_ID=CAMNT_0012025433 /DNA_START=73 /DNA_END=1413 /DNA_ORIENTATION=-
MDFEQITPGQLGNHVAPPAPAKAARSLSSKIAETFQRGVDNISSSLHWVVFEMIWVVCGILGTIVVGAINVFLDYWAPHYMINSQLRGKSKVGGIYATDGVTPPGKGVEASLYAAKYGPLPSESLDTVLCEDRDLAARNPPLLYVHGGGWIAANSACLLHSVAPLARAGFDVYSIDYPLAPMHRFPTPIISVLRALSWLYTHEGHQDVVIMGDSAGGNLVTIAAALVCNRGLLEDFARETQTLEILAYKFPTIVAVSTVYGIMDQEAWLKDLDTISYLENKVTQFCISFAFRQYRDPWNRFKNRITLLDVIDQVEHLPPVLLLCGDRDILVNSNRRAYRELARRKFSVELEEHHGARHCYFGFPPAWVPDGTSKQCLATMLRFFRTETKNYQARQAPGELSSRKIRPLGVPTIRKNPHPNRWYRKESDDEYLAHFMKRHENHYKAA